MKIILIFLYGRKVPFCNHCMRKVRDANNHVCYSSYHCFKCKFQHQKNFNMLSHVICPLCNCAFDNEFCLKSHYVKSVTVGLVNFEGKVRLSPCGLYRFCEKCHSVVRKFYYIDKRGNKKLHNCKTCEVKRPLMHHCFIPNIKKSKHFYSKNPDEKCEIYIYDFETEANPKNLGIF